MLGVYGSSGNRWDGRDPLRVRVGEQDAGPPAVALVQRSVVPVLVQLHTVD